MSGGVPHPGRTLPRDIGQANTLLRHEAIRLTSSNIEEIKMNRIASRINNYFLLAEKQHYCNIYCTKIDVIPVRIESTSNNGRPNFVE